LKAKSDPHSAWQAKGVPGGKNGKYVVHQVGGMRHVWNKAQKLGGDAEGKGFPNAVVADVVVVRVRERAKERLESAWGASGLS